VGTEQNRVVGVVGVPEILVAMLLEPEAMVLTDKLLSLNTFNR
jgi:hypothetical protein